MIAGQILTPVPELSGRLYARNNTQADCQKKIDAAQQLYYEGNFDEALGVLNPCLKDTTLADSLKFDAYKVLAQIMLAKDKQEPAKQVIGKILEMQPDYAPTIEQEPPQFVALVIEVKQQLQTQEKLRKEPAQKEKNNLWWWVGAGGAVVIGAVVYMVTKGDSEAEPLPNPPDWPE